ncbi:MAG TPA: ABC transporter ATP-binding protein [Stackebrandtia sp.]|jgi:ABC-2 type transport system ATP-binding protein|uniref:ABC transporter ATP-binding protein n=1 Tax=Stackebrandtia sp. TaxID=2023065 RepID=UPI002D331FC7|nr:ABC transporter ATP-binding protein [Stackebrandtia sp.]HZE38091.1 ABC transporter ATP-binding protein [Stackebrandtia sp.]
MDDTAIATTGLTKRFGKVTAVDALDLSVRPGQIVGYLGPNGAGKTTTIRMLLGFISPTSGGCRVLGSDPARDTRPRRGIGYLPGDLRVDPGMTATQLFAWFARLRGGVDRRGIDELTQRLDLDPSRRFGTLSKGNRQKVGIVQALCHDPEVLILDEPTSGLDPLVQREFGAILSERAARGAAVLMSSHVLPEVERIASHVAIIRSGRLVAVSDTDTLLDRSLCRLELRFGGDVSAEALSGIDGVVTVDVRGPHATVTVDGPVGPLMREASGLHVPLLRVRSATDDLEDLFLSIYDKESVEGRQP